jgi:hypothetical protein
MKLVYILFLQKTQILLLIVVCSFNLNAQYLPDLKIPQLKPSFYESLQVKTNLETRDDFQLKGTVKSVCETINSFKETPYRSEAFWNTTHYFFQENGNMLSYTEDSTSTLLFDYEGKKRIMNDYDLTGETLVKTTIYLESPWKKSKKVIRYNEQGFMEREEYTCYRYGSDKDNPAETGVFDYMLDYQWSKDFDSVALKYDYRTPASPYTRDQDRMYSFVSEITQKRKLTDKITSFGDNGAEPGFVSLTEEIKRDKQGRVIEMFIWDHTVKNSINVHQKIEYQYNEKGELIEIKHASTAFSNGNDFQLDFRINIDYISYDNQGNWIERIAKLTTEKHSYHMEVNQNTTYFFKRELVYYE